MPPLLLHVLGGLLLIPAVGGLLRLARHRGAALATTGGVLAGIGASFIAADAALFGLTSYFASAPGLDQAAMARYLFTMKADPGAYLLFFVYLLFPVGILVTAIALLRARTVARWQPWLLLVGIVLAVAAPGGIVGGLAQLPLIAAFTALASHLWRPATTPTPTWSTATPHRQAPPTDRAPQTSSFSSVGVAAEGGHLRAWDLPPSACHQRSASCTDPGPWLSPSP